MEGPGDGIDIEFLAAHMQPSAEVLRFYRRKVQSFDKERTDLLQRLADVEAQNAELHRLRWEARSREEEIRELQSALSDAKLHLYDERETALTLAAENDSLKAQEIEDRKRIAHLLALTEPIAQEFTFFRDARSNAATSAPASAAAASSSSSAGGIGRAGFALRPPTTTTATTTAPAAVHIKDGTGARALRTVVLPASPSGSGAAAAASAADTASLTLMVDSLRRQVQELRQLCDDKSAAYARDREALKEMHARKASADAMTIKQLETQLEATQGKLTMLTKDYLLTRHTAATTERDLREQLATSKAAQEQAERELTVAQAQAEADISSLKQQLDATASAIEGQLMSKVSQHNDAVRMAKGRWGQEKADLTQQVEKLKAEVKRGKIKYDTLEKRRAGEVEGYQRDVTALRKSMRQLETQWALIGGVVADAALAAQAEAVKAQMADVAAKLHMPPEEEGGGTALESAAGGDENLEGLDWLPSHAANVPSLVAGIRPGRGMLKAVTGRNTLAGYQPVQYATRELHEVLASQGQSLPGDIDYSVGGKRGAGVSSASAGKISSPSSSYAAGGGPRRVPAASALGGTTTAPAFASPGPAAMQVEERTPGRPLSHPLPLSPDQARFGGSSAAAGGGAGGGGNKSPSTGASSRSSSGPRRVPLTAPNAAPRVDETVRQQGGGGALDSSIASSSSAGFGLGIGGGGVGAGSRGSSALSSPAGAAAASRTYAIRDQLSAIRSRITELDARAAQMAGSSVPGQQ